MRKFQFASREQFREFRRRWHEGESVESLGPAFGVPVKSVYSIALTNGLGRRVRQSQALRERAGMERSA